MTDNTTEREEVAAAVGVPASLLRGDTRAELEHHASQLKDAGYVTELTADQILDINAGRASGQGAEIDHIVSQAIGR